MWEGEDKTPHLSQLPNTKAKRSPTSVPKTTSIKERYLVMSCVQVRLCAFHAILLHVSIVIITNSQVYSSTHLR